MWQRTEKCRLTEDLTRLYSRKMRVMENQSREVEKLDKLSGKTWDIL